MVLLIMLLDAIPVLAIIAASVFLMEPVGVILIGILACAVLLVLNCALVGFAHAKRRRIWPVMTGLAVSLACLFSVMATHWPLRMAYVLSRPAIERLGSEILKGESFSQPKRVGLFTIEKAEVNHSGIVCLWTREDPGGNSGFVQCGPERVPFNLWSMVRLDGRWQWIAED